jgi:hypothetical protein
MQPDHSIQEIIIAVRLQPRPFWDGHFTGWESPLNLEELQQECEPKPVFVILACKQI